jgi:hypothetical protein
MFPTFARFFTDAAFFQANWWIPVIIIAIVLMGISYCCNEGCNV